MLGPGLRRDDEQEKVRLPAAQETRRKLPNEAAVVESQHREVRSGLLAHEVPESSFMVKRSSIQG
jgi:hypothetical protein